MYTLRCISARFNLHRGQILLFHLPPFNSSLHCLLIVFMPKLAVYRHILDISMPDERIAILASCPLLNDACAAPAFLSLSLMCGEKNVVHQLVLFFFVASAVLPEYGKSAQQHDKL